MREDNGDQAHRVFDLPINNLDFDDFHPYPLTFRDALSTDDVLRVSQEPKSVEPMDLDFRHNEVNPRDKDADSERGDIDSGEVSAEGADFKVLSTRNSSRDNSGREAGGSGVRGAAGDSSGSGFAADDGLDSH